MLYGPAHCSTGPLYDIDSLKLTYPVPVYCIPVRLNPPKYRDFFNRPLKIIGVRYNIHRTPIMYFLNMLMNFLI